MNINIRGKLIDLTKPRIMGIINVTDDSFYSGSRYLSAGRIAEAADRMMSEGADILDIGGCSTRPGSLPVSEEEETERVCRAAEAVRKRYPDSVISADTYRSSVARRAVRDAGVDIINDISGGEMDGEMFPLVAELGVPYIMMHMQGTPLTMQANPQYVDVVGDILMWFGQRVPLLRAAGVRDIIADPGFGFGKTVSQNFEMLRRLHEFQIMNLPVLAGLSRKSMIWRTLDVTPDQALNGTSALNMAALMGGASMLRVHDAREAREVVSLFEKMCPEGSRFDHYC